jgi:gliding motility-associated-like protein
MRKLITITFLLCASTIVFSQINLDQQVIGSTGGFSTGSTMTLSSTVGEAVVQSIFSVNMILTQGFQQPMGSLLVVSPDSTIFAEVINATCISGGSIFVSSVANCTSTTGYAVTITLENDTIELSADSLSAGVYNLNVLGDSGCTSTTTIVVGFDAGTNCTIKLYSGITPNGDGNNDRWEIDNIGLFPENTVQLFNRWGSEIWLGKGYNNKDVVWEGLDNAGVQLSDATYFYVVTINGKVTRGWVELTR